MLYHPWAKNWLQQSAKRTRLVLCDTANRHVSQASKLLSLCQLLNDRLLSSIWFMSRQRVATKVWYFSTVPSLVLKVKHFSYMAGEGSRGEGQEGKILFFKTSFFLQNVMFWIFPPELVKTQWSVRLFRSRGFCSTPYKLWFYTGNEWPAAGVRFHGQSNLWCKGAFPSFQIQKNLRMRHLTVVWQLCEWGKCFCQH